MELPAASVLFLSVAENELTFAGKAAERMIRQNATATGGKWVRPKQVILNVSISMQAIPVLPCGIDQSAAKWAHRLSLAGQTAIPRASSFSFRSGQPSPAQLRLVMEGGPKSADGRESELAPASLSCPRSGPLSADVISES